MPANMSNSTTNPNDLTWTQHTYWNYPWYYCYCGCSAKVIDLEERVKKLERKVAKLNARSRGKSV